MAIACTANDWATIVLPGLTLIITISGIIVVYYEARVTQKITLSNKRVNAYVLLQALKNSLEMAYKSASLKMPPSASDFAVDWITELQKERAIIDLYNKVSIGVQSLNLLQLRDMIEPDFSIVRYIFFGVKSASGVGLIVKDLGKYGAAHNAYVQSAYNIPFTNKDMEMIKATVDEARQSLMSMDKEMTIRNIINR